MVLVWKVLAPGLAPLYNPMRGKAEEASACIDQFEFANFPCSYPRALRRKGLDLHIGSGPHHPHRHNPFLRLSSSPVHVADGEIPLFDL